MYIYTHTHKYTDDTWTAWELIQISFIVSPLRICPSSTTTNPTNCRPWSSTAFTKRYLSISRPVRFKHVSYKGQLCVFVCVCVCVCVCRETERSKWINRNRQIIQASKFQDSRDFVFSLLMLHCSPGTLINIFGMNKWTFMLCDTGFISIISSTKRIQYKLSPNTSQEIIKH